MVDFSKIFASNGTATAPTDAQYLQGFDFLGSAPPTVELFNYLQQNTDLKLKDLHDNMPVGSNYLPLVGGNLTGAINETAVTLASASTMNIGAAAGNAINVTGTNNISAFDVVQAGTRRILRFSAGLTIMYNATSLILSKAANLPVYAGDVLEFISLGGGNWYCSTYTPAALNLFVQIRMERSSGNPDGTFSAGAWRTRNLNVIDNNDGNIASLNNNQVALPAGTYIVDGSAPASNTDVHQCRLQNITDGATVFYGSTENASGSTASDGIATTSRVTGKFTITAGKTFELQHYAQSTGTFGSPGSFGNIEVYAVLRFWKVG